MRMGLLLKNQKKSEKDNGNTANIRGMLMDAL